jgi:hypothetical protein
MTGKLAKLRARGRAGRNNPGITGMGPGAVRTSDHAASKPGHLHISDMARDPALRAQRSQDWSRETGRPIPPCVRARGAMREPRPMTAGWRMQHYLDARGGRGLTSAQNRRITHKINHLAARSNAGATITFKDPKC